MNFDGNKDIVRYGKNSRFGQPDGADPHTAQRAATPPWAIRNAIRRLAGQTFPIERQLTLDDLLEVFGRNVTAAQMTAAKRWLLALQGNHKAMDQVMRATDGPL